MNHQKIAWTNHLDTKTDQVLTLDLEVDAQAVFRQLAQKAIRSKRGESRLCGGALRVRVRKAGKR